MSARRVLQESVFALLVLLAVALAAVLLLAMSGRLTTQPEPDAAPVGRRAAPAPREEPPAEQAPERAAAVAAAAPAPTRAAVNVVRLTASRGDCWLSARRGSADGAVLYEGVLAEGEAITLRAPAVWVRFGAADNVDVTVNGRRTAVPPGTVDVVLTERAA